VKKYILLILVFVYVLTIGGCNSNEPDDVPETPDKEPGMIGYVMDANNGGILVVDPISQDFSSTGGVNEFYNAIWFSDVQEDIKEGDKVKVWFDIVAESYPGQSKAIDIEVIPSSKPDGTDLDESQAINKALNSGEVNTSWPTVVKSVKYIKEADLWEIEIRDAIGEQIKSFNIKIDDKI